MAILAPLVSNLRYRHVFKLLNRQGIKLKGKRVIDFGSGNGHFAKMLWHKGAKVITVDKYNHHAFFRYDLNNPLPFPDNYCDIAFALAVVEHLKNPILFMKEIVRVSREISILTTPHRKAKPVLEFLASLNLINRKHIEDHKIYFDNNSLELLGFNVTTFMYGFNIIFYK